MAKTTNKKDYGQVIRDKMRCLDDFGICDRFNKEMRNKLELAILENPDKDPREVLDYFCRPMIQAKINTWTD